MRSVTILLLFATISTVLSFSPVMSQTFTTVTNVSTVTNIVSTNVYSTNTVEATTVTVEHTSGFYSIATVPYFDTCDYVPYRVTIDPGTTEVFGTIGPASGYVFPANSPSTVRFYFAIVTKEQYDIATVSHGCGRFPFGIVHEVVTLSYSLDWKNPTPGLYYFIFQGLDDHISWNYPQF